METFSFSLSSYQWPLAWLSPFGFVSFGSLGCLFKRFVGRCSLLSLLPHGLPRLPFLVNVVIESVFRSLVHTVSLLAILFVPHVVALATPLFPTPIVCWSPVILSLDPSTPSTVTLLSTRLVLLDAPLRISETNLDYIPIIFLYVDCELLLLSRCPKRFVQTDLFPLVLCHPNISDIGHIEFGIYNHHKTWRDAPSPLNANGLSVCSWTSNRFVLPKRWPDYRVWIVVSNKAHERLRLYNLSIFYFVESE